MAYSLDLNKLVHDIRGPKGVAAITEELVKIRGEFSRVSSRFQPEAEKRLKELQKNINVVRKSFESRIKRIEKDIQSTLKMVKKSANQAEGKLQSVMGKGAKKTRKSTSKKAPGKRTRAKARA